MALAFPLGHALGSPQTGLCVGQWNHPCDIESRHSPGIESHDIGRASLPQQKLGRLRGIAFGGAAVLTVGIAQRRWASNAKKAPRGARCVLRASSVKETAESCLLNNYGSRGLVLTSGQGSIVHDDTGKEYLDFAAGIAVNCLGHSDAGWAEVVAQQAKTLTHTSNLYLTLPQVDLAKKLTELTFADKAFFCNSGTEANEAAIKFARKFHTEAGKPRERFVAFENAFHGRTMGALALTWKEAYKVPFEPLMPAAEFLTFNSTEGLDRIDESTCAVFIEPVQGEGGVIPATSEFLKALRKRCDEVGALLIFDEVQCGLGRTGHLFGYELKGVTPDIMTLAKPLAAGLPIGAVLMSDRVAAAIKPGDHGSTFAGAPLVCAAANYTLDVVSKPSFLANVKEAGQALHEGLQELFKDREDISVRGEGLLRGVVFPTAEECSKLQKAAAEEGLLVLTAGQGNVMRFTPPLIVTVEDVKRCLELLQKACKVAGH